MSSHREAPEISKDPALDNTDTYAFISPDKPGTVTLVACYNPFEKPDGGPNFYEFTSRGVYEIHISNAGDAQADITYQFKFDTQIRNNSTFLYNTGVIKNITDKSFNRPQTYTVSRIDRAGNATVLGKGLTVPPVNIGIRSTPNYPLLARQAIHTLPGNRTVFAGPRADPFHVDLGSIFDLGAIRSLNAAHLIPEAMANAVDGLQGLNCHAIVLQVPISDLTKNGDTPTDVTAATSVIGVWASASRQKSRIYNGDHVHGRSSYTGPNVQVSRLGVPLFNELLVTMDQKDKWNAQKPSGDSNYAGGVTKPELGGLLPVLYPGAFPNLAKYTKPRADLAAIILTGIPNGIIKGFQNYTGAVQADMQRLNVAIPASTSPSALGILGGDLAGFPNGRRLADDVVAIELQAVAGQTIPLVDPTFTPDAASKGLADGTINTNLPYLTSFPYLGTPAGGYQTTEAS